VIANGGSVTLLFEVSWSNGVTLGTISAAVTSDLPNPVPSGSSSAIQVAVNASDNSDVPTMPEWGLILLAMLLMGTAVRMQR